MRYKKKLFYYRVKEIIDNFNKDNFRIEHNKFYLIHSLFKGVNSFELENWICSMISPYQISAKVTKKSSKSIHFIDSFSYSYQQNLSVQTWFCYLYSYCWWIINQYFLLFKSIIGRQPHRKEKKPMTTAILFKIMQNVCFQFKLHTASLRLHNNVSYRHNKSYWIRWKSAIQPLWNFFPCEKWYSLFCKIESIYGIFVPMQLNVVQIYHLRQVMEWTNELIMAGNYLVEFLHLDKFLIINSYLIMNE